VSTSNNEAPATPSPEATQTPTVEKPKRGRPVKTNPVAQTPPVINQDSQAQKTITEAPKKQSFTSAPEFHDVLDKLHHSKSSSDIVNANAYKLSKGLVNGDVHLEDIPDQNKELVDKHLRHYIKRNNITEVPEPIADFLLNKEKKPQTRIREQEQAIPNTNLDEVNKELFTSLENGPGYDEEAQKRWDAYFKKHDTGHNFAPRKPPSEYK